MHNEASLFFHKQERGVHMENFYTMAETQATLFIYILVGFFIRKKNWITKSTRKELIDVIINVLLPCMIFESFNQSLTTQQLISASLVLGVAFAVSFFSVLIGKIAFRSYPTQQQVIMKYGTLVPNSGFAGLPMISTIYGSLGLFYASIFVIPNRIFMWSAGISMFTQVDRKKRIKSVLLNPGIIAVFIGILRMLSGITLPVFIDKSLNGMGSCTTALSMIMVGSILADTDVKTILSCGSLHLTFIRLILLPVITLMVLRYLCFDAVPMATAVILTGMPVGSTTAILAEKYGADAGFASKCVFLSTVLSLITIPVLAIFL